MEPQDVAGQIAQWASENGGVAVIGKPTPWDRFNERNGLYILKNQGYLIEESDTKITVTAPGRAT